MFDEVAANAGTIIVLLVIMWLAQFGLVYWQMKRLNKRLKILRKGGLTAIGVSGNQFKGRAYAFLTIDEDNNVVYAEQFSGWTVWSQLRPVQGIVGMSLQDILDNAEALPVSKKLQVAFGNAARDLQAARESPQDDTQLQPAPNGSLL